MWNEYFLASKGISLRRTETDFTLVECFEPSHDHCGLSGRCQRQSVLRQALEAVAGDTGVGEVRSAFRGWWRIWWLWQRGSV